MKVGRNDPCPCGSGRKHKRCCGTSSLDVFGQMQRVAYENPLTRAAHARQMVFFRQLASGMSAGLTINK